MQKLHELSHKKSSSDMAFQELVSQHGQSYFQVRPELLRYQNSNSISRCS